MVKKILGRTGISVTPVGMGTLTMGFSQKNLDIEAGSRIIVHAVEQGINFLDTAQYYDTYRYLRPALDEIRQRDLDFPIICSKTLEEGYAETEAAVLECLEQLDIDAVDLFLLHEVRGTEDFYARKDAWRSLCDLKAKGLIKAIGISTHHVDACAEMAAISECDVVFTLINQDGMGIRKGLEPGTREEMEAAIRKCADAGKGIFTMKAFGGGNLIHDYRSCLEYAAGIPGNTSVMIGMADTEQVDRAVEFFSGRLSADYQIGRASCRERV